MSATMHCWLIVLCFVSTLFLYTLQWRHNELDGVLNHQPHDCLLAHLFRHRSKKPSKLRVTGLCEGNSPVTGEFPAQRAVTRKTFPIWWRHFAFGGGIVHVHLVCFWEYSQKITLSGRHQRVLLKLGWTPEGASMFMIFPMLCSLSCMRF